MNEKTISPTIALDSLGCKLNQAEIQQLARQLEAVGYRLVDPAEKADIYVLNTCSVTHVADRKSRHLLRLARRRNPAARLIAIGCYAQRAPAELGNIEGVELVLGNDRKMNLINYILQNIGSPLTIAPVPSGPNAVGRTRAFLKIQDGCKNFCAYCIVPLVRSREQNVAVDKILALIKGFVANGTREVVLTGTEIGAYNSDGVNLEGLIKRILADTPVPRLRLSSLQPHQISEELISLWRDSRLCPHFHLSLQSGSDAVLVRMKRRYTVADYRQMVVLIREKVPGVAITTDVIVGFPSETDTEFQETLGFCRDMQFARIHVFPFSPRPGTEAASMPNQVSDAVKKERSNLMLALSKESVKAFQQHFIGKTMDVLWEKQSQGVWSGLTGNYIKVYARSSASLTNLITPVKLLKLYRDGVYGII
ncbi:MAG: tRNA (N(6)-L-threonylcarbamoyladenosine(37)-C(2))-methylthiotransferase MtaB [Chloroflexi bacterium RBG_16_50_11]|nr:MAG: tRNA (N(6)-L-threonylcarbamoyladenosine(37)-C(2))-methylthiotransferase MtaB [Chloroflexi bacterium RBG_16_50_11]